MRKYALVKQKQRIKLYLTLNTMVCPLDLDLTTND